MRLQRSSHVRLLKVSRIYIADFIRHWDWSLDSEDITKSPVFDSTYGFGGDGDPIAPKSVAYGHCVTDGPFANLEALYFGTEDRKHCLSRGFTSSEDSHAGGKYISPEALEETLASPEYDAFYRKLEYGAHNAVPLIIRGDFFKVTAPYGTFSQNRTWPQQVAAGLSVGMTDIDHSKIPDTLFFLHHTQLDRLWHR